VFTLALPAGRLRSLEIVNCASHNRPSAHERVNIYNAAGRHAVMDTSYLAQQVTTIIGQLHGLFDEIGVASHERDSREAEVVATHFIHLQLN